MPRQAVLLLTQPQEGESAAHAQLGHRRFAQPQSAVLGHLADQRHGIERAIRTPGVDLLQGQLGGELHALVQGLGPIQPLLQLRGVAVVEEKQRFR